MKNLRPFIFIAGMLYMFAAMPAASAQYEHAGQYMETLFANHPQFTQSLWNYIRVAARGKNTKRIESRRAELIATTTQIQRKIDRMPPYEGDVSLRDSVVSYFNLVYNILNEDYAKIVNLEEIAEQSYDLMEAYILTKEQANDKLEAASDMLDEVQAAFAARHRVILHEGEKSKEAQKLEKAGDVVKYYNVLYLAFFKCYKQEVYLLEALDRNDVNALMQNQNALAQYAKEGLAKIDTLPDYDGDPSLKESAKVLFDFYYVEGKEKAPVFSGYYLKKENFEKLQHIVEAKDPKDRSQKDIDQYNKAVNVYNEAVNDFNVTNQELNQRRSQLLENWNKAVDKFMDRHVPR